MFTKFNFLNLLNAIGPVTAALPAVREVVDTIINTFKNPVEQQDLKETYQRFIQDNDAGHARLQDKLAQAGKE